MPLPLAQNDVAQMDVIIEESGNSSEEMLGERTLNCEINLKEDF